MSIYTKINILCAITSFCCFFITSDVLLSIIVYSILLGLCLLYRLIRLTARR